MSILQVTPIPAFQDNYFWLLSQPDDAFCYIVDPGDAEPVLETLQQQQLELAGILITHHHRDHIGGIQPLLGAFPQVQIYGPANESIPECEHTLVENDVIELEELGTSLRILDVPGHTAGHIAYIGESNLFCGDTLFAAGCGRLFEGTPEQMQTSLEKLRALDDDTVVYCAHEYTLDNIAFAKWVEPDNADLLRREQDEQTKRRRKQPTVPSTIGLEKRTNPFLRYDQANVIQMAEHYAKRRLCTAAEVFGAIREWKDTEFD